MFWVDSVPAEPVSDEDMDAWEEIGKAVDGFVFVYDREKVKL